MAPAAPSRSPATLSHPKYRPDIDGLRAIAVLSVVFFHAFPDWGGGGYVGVDIFFVISGYLITTIIFENLERDHFSFAQFYGRRIRRIFPALLLVLVASLAVGWFDLLADEFDQLGLHVAAGAGFVSNLVLWHESGYFDKDSATKPLLHLWSLGIEEQYYIVWPLLAWLAWKRRLGLLALTLLVAAASFGVNVYTVGAHPVAAFYSPLSRFWELMIGSLLAYVSLHHPQLLLGSGKRRADLLSFSGLCAIAAALLLLDRDSSFPGWWALLPTLGAALVIAAGPQSWLNRHLLANRVAVWFGLISFPLYLWHWPLLSFAHIDAGAESSRPFRLALMVGAVGLAWITCRWIERPLRFGGDARVTTWGLTIAMTVTGLAGYGVHRGHGIDGHGFRSEDRGIFYRHFADIPSGIWSSTFEREFRHDCNLYPWIRQNFALGDTMDAACYTPATPRRNVVFIWGDSHAQMLNYGLRRTLPADWQVLQVASSKCPASLLPQAESPAYCQRSNALAAAAIRQYRPEVVVIAQKDGHEAARMQSMAAALKNLGVGRVVFTGPVPQWNGDLPKLIVRRFWRDTPERTYDSINTAVLAQDAELRRALAPLPDVVFVDLVRFFCNDQGCLTRVGSDRSRDITTWDYGHLTSEASEALARGLLADAVLGRLPPAP